MSFGLWSLKIKGQSPTIVLIKTDFVHLFLYKSVIDRPVEILNTPCGESNTVYSKLWIITETHTLKNTCKYNSLIFLQYVVLLHNENYVR